MLREPKVAAGDSRHGQALTAQLVSLLVGVQRCKPHQPIRVESTLTVAALVRPDSVDDVVSLQRAR